MKGMHNPLNSIFICELKETGKITDGSDKTVFNSNTSISRADVAAFMLDQLTETSCVKKASWLKV